MIVFYCDCFSRTAIIFMLRFSRHFLKVPRIYFLKREKILFEICQIGPSHRYHLRKKLVLQLRIHSASRLFANSVVLNPLAPAPPVAKRPLPLCGRGCTRKRPLQPGWRWGSQKQKGQSTGGESKAGGKKGGKNASFPGDAMKQTNNPNYIVMVIGCC